MTDYKFECKACTYYTNNKFCYDKHVKSYKHSSKQAEYNRIKKEKEDREQREREEREERAKKDIKNVFMCIRCNSSFTTSQSLSRHSVTCAQRNSFVDKIQELENIIQTKDKHMQTMENTIKMLQETINYERTQEKSQMSASNYLSVTYHASPVLSQLRDMSIFLNNETDNEIDYASDDESDNEEDNEIRNKNLLLDNLISFHRENKLVNFIGKALVLQYKTNDPHDQSVWNSDTDRLTYFIKKKLKWSIDKKGIKTGNLIVEPGLKYFHEILQEFVTSNPSRKLSTRESIQDNERRQTCYKIMQDIEKGTLLNQVLKYIAPHLYLDKQLKHVPPPPKIMKRITNK